MTAPTAAWGRSRGFLRFRSGTNISAENRRLPQSRLLPVAQEPFFADRRIGRPSCALARPKKPRAEPRSAFDLAPSRSRRNPEDSRTNHSLDWARFSRRCSPWRMAFMNRQFHSTRHEGMRLVRSGPSGFPKPPTRSLSPPYGSSPARACAQSSNFGARKALTSSRFLQQCRIIFLPLPNPNS